MDLSNVDTSAAHTKGAFLHMANPFTHQMMYIGAPEHVDPKTGHLTDAVLDLPDEERAALIGAYDDDKAAIKPVGAMVIGFESPTMRKHQSSVNLRKAVADRDGKKLDEEALGLETVCKMLIKFVNWFDGSRELVAPDDNEDFFRRSDNFIGQVYAFGRKNKSFFPGSSDEPS